MAHLTTYLDIESRKILRSRKKINRHDREVMENVRTVLPSNTRKIFVRVGDFLIISEYFAYFIECYL